MCHQLSDVQERAMETMHRLSMEYALLKDREKRKKVVEEMDKLELEFSEANEQAQEYLDARKDELSTLATEASENTRRCRITESVAKKSVNKFKGTKLRIKRSLMITKSHYGSFIVIKKRHSTLEVEDLRKNRTKRQRLVGICGIN